MEAPASLHNLEKKVLLVLNEFGGIAFVNEIISKSGLSEAEINKGVEWLKEKKLIKIDEQLKEIISSDELALEYAISDFPEQKFLKALLKGPVLIKDLQETAHLNRDEFNVSLGTLKALEFILLASGKVSITDSGKDLIPQLEKQKELIKLIEEPKYMDEIPQELSIFVNNLERRGLIHKKIEKIKKIVLESSAKSFMPHLEITDEIDLLDSAMIINKSWKDKAFRKFSLSVPASKLHPGKRQPYMKYIQDAKKVLMGLGFEEMKGPMVEFSLYNCDLLYMPQDHPAREIQDVFFLKDIKGSLAKHMDIAEKVKNVHETGKGTESTGWKYKFSMEKTAQILLRSQTTAVSGRTLASKTLKIPGKYFTIDRNFRVDTIDWSHLLEFDQLEGIVLDEHVTFRELLGMLKLAAKELGGVDEIKFTPGYFPFTEPSVELHAHMKGKGWVELGGAGMFRPEVLEPLGIKVPVIAWGLGLGRLFMLKNNINDIRQLYSTDLKWMREFKW